MAPEDKFDFAKYFQPIIDEFAIVGREVEIKKRDKKRQRGGSDYTASLIGAAVNASEIQIWTDIDGMHNNDCLLYTSRCV